MTDALGQGTAPPAPPAVLRDLAVLFVGWGLGILSSPITDAIRRRSAKQRLSRVAVTELRSLQDTLAGVVVQLARRRRVLSHSLLEALMTTLKSSGQAGGEGRALRAIGALLELDDRALAASQAPDPPPHPRHVLSLKVYGLPFLESHLHRLDLYELETQRQLVEIRAGLQLFNQYADEAMHYHFLTFTSGIGKDHLDALLGNVETCYERAAEKASDLVSRVAVLLQSGELRPE
jgi:hypothetical protein